jgi:hypothetical protein
MLKGLNPGDAGIEREEISKKYLISVGSISNNVNKYPKI